MTLHVEAFAKINPSLVVVGKRTDGYHELDTVFQAIDLSDLLAFESANDIRLSVDVPGLTAGEDNLVVKAARLLRRECGVSAGAAIRLDKRIPWGAGLGGGSSDAAAALRGLAALWKLDVPVETLHRIALGLGSDVPYFLVGGRARGRGRGEKLERLADGPTQGVLLLIPPFPLSTPEVFRALRAPALTASAIDTSLRASDRDVFSDRNDLEPAAETLRPEVRRLREALRDAGARSARLSGSGSTVFGLFADYRAAERAWSRLPDLPAGTRGIVTTTLSSTDFARRAAPMSTDNAG